MIAYIYNNNRQKYEGGGGQSPGCEVRDRLIVPGSELNAAIRADDAGGAVAARLSRPVARCRVRSVPRPPPCRCSDGSPPDDLARVLAW